MLRVAVVGVGYLGKFHANKFRDLDYCQLSAVVDPNPDTGRAVARENCTCFYPCHRSLLESAAVDAVSIAAPTSSYYEKAKTSADVPVFSSDQRIFSNRDSLKLEIKDFLDCVQHARTPRVSGEDSARVLDLATRITDIIARQQP